MLNVADTSWITSLVENQWGFRSPAAAWLLPLLLLAAVAYALWLYRATTLARRWRHALFAVRTVVLVLVLTMLFQPVMVAESVSQVPQHVLVMLDVSQSMALRDQRQAQSERAEAALALSQGVHRYAELQRRLARALREVRRARDAAERAQMAALIDAHADWREALEAIEPAQESLNSTDTDAFRAEVDVWREQCERLHERLEQALHAGELNAQQRQEFASVYGDLSRAIDGRIDQFATAALRSEIFSAPAMPSRHELALGLLGEREDSIFDALERRYRVRYFTFGEDLFPLGEDVAAPRQRLLASRPDDPSTRLGTALDEVVSRHAGHLIAGVVVLTDGGFNRGLDPLVVAQRLGERGIPVHPVGLGLPAPPDLVLAQIVAPPAALVRDVVPLQVQLQSAGFDATTVSITAELDGQTVAEQTLTLQGDSQWVEMRFQSERAIEAGELTVRVSELEGEVSHANNVRRQSFRAIDEKIQVLYIEGKPRWEFRYLRAVLLRDHRLNVHLLMTEGDRELARASAEHIAALPADPLRLFEYDVVILGDVPAGYFSTRQLEMLRELVRERGGAIAMIAGAGHAPGSYDGTPLADVLPVRLASRGHVSVEDSARWQITEAGRRSAMTRLAPDDDDNDRIWHTVAPLLRLPDLAGLKPGATALAQLENSRLATEEQPYPLLAWQRYGSGRSLFVATDQLWRLRYLRGDEHHARFWGQAIQFLTLARIMGDAKRVQIFTDTEEYRAGQRVRVSAHVLGESYQPLALDEYVLELEQQETESGDDALKPILQGESRVRLQAVPGSPGLFETSFTAEPGSYRIHDPAVPDDATAARFRVEQVPLEMVEPRMQEELLRQIADRSGGRFFRVADLPALTELLDHAPRSVIVRRERELWSQPWLLALLLALLGGEWFVRRRFQQL